MGSVGLIVSATLLTAACGIDYALPTTTDAPRYASVGDVFDHAVARTCSLNNGVCHNSNNYPDLHTVASLVATIDRPCNIDVDDPTLIHDACEPEADRLVIARAGIDARIVHAALLPAEQDNDVRDLTRVTLRLDAPPTGVMPGETELEVHRGSTVFVVGELGTKVSSVTGNEVVLDLGVASDLSSKRFFDVRAYPPGPLRVHVGDPNGNGIEGARGHAMPLIAVGDPDGSYLMRRLIDASYGELMPRQCRTWTDEANRAMACWIAGLAVDDSGSVVNAYEPINYADCSVEVTGLGKCAEDGPR